jgi:hypothetical protein
MVACLHADPICDMCARSELYNQNNVIIAQLQRLLDLMEREAGYDNIPLFLIFPSLGAAALTTNFDYLLPQFEMPALLQNLVVSTDATSVSLDICLYHESIVPSPLTVNTTRPNRTILMRYAGTGTMPPINGKITIPARGFVGARFNALTGGSFLAISASYSRSEQTTIEWFRGQRAGRQ